MTLRKKTIIIIGVTLAGLIFILYAISRVILLNSFAELEEQNTRRNVERILSALSDDLSHLNHLTGDWAGWNDTYAFIEDANDDYVKSNLVDETFNELKINIMLFINSSGQIIFGKGFDLKKGKEIPVPKSLQEHISANSLLVCHPDTKSSITGIILLPEGPMLVASRPILTSEEKGPIRGALIMGRYLDSPEIKHLAEKTHLSLTMHNLNNSQIPPDFQAALSGLSEEAPIFVRPLSAESVAGYALLKDIYGNPGLVLRVDMPREIYGQGQASMQYFILSLLVIGLVFGVVTLLLLEKVVLSRLALLSAGVNSVGASSDHSARVSMTGRDELSNLAGAINEMLEALEHSQSELKESRERYRKLANKLHTAHQQLLDIIEFLPDATFVIDHDKKVIAWNRAIEEMTGVCKEEIIGKGDYAYAVPFYGKQRPMLIDLVFADNREIEQKYDYVEKKGNTIYTAVFTPPAFKDKEVFLWAAASPLFDSDGNLVGGIASIRDITERKQAETLFKTLFSSSPIGIYIVQDGKFQFVNPQFQKHTGYSEDELLGMDSLKIVLPEDRNMVRENAVKMLKGERSSPYEYRVINKCGETRWIMETVTSIQYQGRRATLGNYMDITERKLMEEQLKYLSLHDPLTGLYNRAYFEQEMHRLESGRYNPVGIIVCDMDGLKLVNDTLGHDAGDALLVAAAGVIKKAFREGDVVARIGGDEFAVLLPNSDKTTVKSACLRIQDAIAKYNAANPELPLSISIGFAVSSQTSTSMWELFKEADNNMYREKLHRSQSAKSAIVQALIKTLEARDFITKDHSDRLQDLVAGLAIAIGLPECNVTDLRIMAQFHDIGKVGIPDRILFKKGPLTPKEFSEIQRHCEIGYRIAQSAPDLAPIADWILKHHEWWNGKGYPLGIKGKEIPLECRILAIADAYNAMTSDRPYRKAMSHEEAVAELRRCAGIQFDPHLVQKFVQVLENQNLVSTDTGPDPEKNISASGN
jgi:diguanylate cyclase (GGDEF)-like protein/PAS domain S-box-containing protein